MRQSERKSEIGRRGEAFGDGKQGLGREGEGSNPTPENLGGRGRRVNPTPQNWVGGAGGDGGVPHMHMCWRTTVWSLLDKAGSLLLNGTGEGSKH